ncbi:MAG TPA: hypothetical protein VGX48_14580, partial [Pyrinomonadaceae bacterium]|nr:hypothetical protein [Pyrinomonadaceae bacterium]
CLSTGKDFSYVHMSGPELKQSEQWFEKWTQSVKETLEGMFTTQEIGERFSSVTFPSIDMRLSDEGNRYYNLARSVEKKIAWLESLHESLDTYAPTVEAKPDTLGIIRLLCSRFHTVARQLRQRHKRRETLDISDEYDVQDVLHALLRIYFDDIREEEHTPVSVDFFKVIRHSLTKVGDITES